MRRARLLVPAQPRLFLDSPDWRQSAAGREWERERDDGDERRGSWLASGSWWFVGDDAVLLFTVLQSSEFQRFSEVERVSCERIASFLTTVVVSPSPPP
ncbi:Os01g0880500 [Oryza sativa Japonica Group]|uniref:Os01g0880500 protein n=1 Tax=Oryza sativa subsp. japonica TaxID=39947 RepID=C7IXH1_ORYSJ|nr:Os01g0880500 [Oryza sativa Japonica Group]|eukprot:NP_001172676.1 Os01g0880500 [Oryza sativa Japonica Group]